MNNKLFSTSKGIHPRISGNTSFWKSFLPILPYWVAMAFLSLPVAAFAQWDISVIDSGDQNSLAVDSRNNVHISYSTPGPAYALNYATNASGSWSLSVIDNSRRVE
jgi:hypothetical protein